MVTTQAILLVAVDNAVVTVHKFPASLIAEIHAALYPVNVARLAVV